MVLQQKLPIGLASLILDHQTTPPSALTSVIHMPGISSLTFFASSSLLFLFFLLVHLLVFCLRPPFELTLNLKLALNML